MSLRGGPRPASSALIFLLCNSSTATRLVPGRHFLQMDAARMAFDEASFDVVLCVEAAFHFDTRRDFLREGPADSQARRLPPHVGYTLSFNALGWRLVGSSEQSPSGYSGLSRIGPLGGV